MLLGGKVDSYINYENRMEKVIATTQTLDHGPMCKAQLSSFRKLLFRHLAIAHKYLKLFKISSTVINCRLIIKDS